MDRKPSLSTINVLKTSHEFQLQALSCHKDVSYLKNVFQTRDDLETAKNLTFKSVRLQRPKDVQYLHNYSFVEIKTTFL